LARVSVGGSATTARARRTGDTVATRAKPQATKTARRRGSSRSVDVPHTGVCVRAVGQRAGEVAEREVKVPACEQSINVSPDKHKGVVRATRALGSRETRCSAEKWSDTTARTRVSTLAC
jgi:hypothetical protein